MSRRAESRRKRPDTTVTANPDALTVTPTVVAAVTLLPLSGWLLAAALAFLALGGGILYDRVLAGVGPAGPMELVATPLAAALIGGGVLLTFWYPREALPARPNNRLITPALCFALFLLWCALSLVRSGYMHSSVTVLSLFAAAFGAGVIAFRAARTERAITALLWAYTAAASVVSGIGINEYLRELRGGNALWRVFAGFVNPDFLAGYLLMAFPVAIILLLISRTPSARLLAGLASLLQVVCLVLTGSRLGLAAMVLSLVVFAVLALRSGALSPQTRRVSLIAGAVLLVGIIAAGRPLLRRLLSSGTESYSAQFRVRTWQGARRMAAANPILGTGIGTFETAYSRYAVVGYTQHAHNSFIQVAGEAGFPGAALLVTGLAGILLTGVGAAGRAKARNADEQMGSTDSDETALRLIAAGLTASVVAAVIHNLSDSDIYIPANAILLGVLCGLTLGTSSSVRNDDTAMPAHPVRLPQLVSPILPSLVAVAVLVQAFIVLAGRIAANGAELDSAIAFSSIANHASGDSASDVRASLERAVAGYEAAESRDTLNPEYPMKLASLLEFLGRMAEAEAESRKAISRAAIGKTYYRYGRILAREGKAAEATSMHERARAVEPNNLGNLLALADTYLAFNRQADAESIYRYMVELSRGDFGKIRAVPELVEWEYGRALLGLGGAKLQRNDFAGAADDLREAVGRLGEFWRQRHLLIAEIRVRPEERKRTADYYRQALSAYEKALTAQGKSGEAMEVSAHANSFDEERAKEGKASTNDNLG